MTEKLTPDQQAQVLMLKIETTIRENLANGLQESLADLAKKHTHFDENLLNSIVTYIRGH